MTCVCGYKTKWTYQVLEPYHPLDATPKLKLAEQGCTDASWQVVQFSDKDACSSQDFPRETSGVVAERCRQEQAYKQTEKNRQLQLQVDCMDRYQARLRRQLLCHSSSAEKPAANGAVWNNSNP